MCLTERERQILKLVTHGLSDYKVARQLGVDPPTVTRSRKNALRKLNEAEKDLDWAQQIGWEVKTAKC